MEDKKWDEEGLSGTLLGKFGCFSFDGKASETKHREELEEGEYFYVGFIFCFGLTPCNMEYMVEEKVEDKLGRKCLQRAKEADRAAADVPLCGGTYRVAICDGNSIDVDPLSAEEGVTRMNRMVRCEFVLMKDILNMCVSIEVRSF